MEGREGEEGKGVGKGVGREWGGRRERGGEGRDAVGGYNIGMK